MVLSKTKDVPSMEFIAMDSVKEKEKTKSKKKKESLDFTSLKSGVIFLRNIPHGFYEKQMRGYFSQFGDVLQVKLARNKKDGSSEGYAYIEFAHEEVAKIAAETMNNYLMFEECLKCEFVPEDKVPSDAFAPNMRYRKPARNERYFKSLKRSLSSEEIERRKEETNQRLEGLHEQYRELGITYDWGDLKANPDFVPPPKRVFQEAESESNEQKRVSVKQKLKEWVKGFDFYENEDGECVVKKFPKIQRRSKKKKKQMSKRLKVDNKSNNQSSTKDDQAVEVQENDENNHREAINVLNTTPEMVVDLEDDEVTFKTPPSVKIKKRLMATPGVDEQDVSTPNRNKKRVKTPSSSRADRKRKLLLLRNELGD